MVVVGNDKLMRAYDVELTPILSIAKKLREDSKTVVYVATSGKLIGAIAIADTPRKHALQVISHLKNRGLKVVMLTGDNKVTAKVNKYN